MKRYMVALMCCLANALFYCIRQNVNVAIVEMVRKKSTTNWNSMDNGTAADLMHSSIPSFDWDVITQQRILRAFYYGFVPMAIPGGWIAGKIGGKRIMLFSVILQSLASALKPWAAGITSGLLITLQIFDGIGQGLAIPTIYVILGKWTVPGERSTLVSIAIGGTTFGLTISGYLSGWICSAYELGGWPMSFYTYSVVGVVWSIIWEILIYETPNEDPCISSVEKEYLKKSIISAETTDSKHNSWVPWRAILTSSVVWALVIGETTFNFGYFFILTETPIFISTILGCSDIQTIGNLVSISSIGRILTVILSALCSDYVIRREYLSVLNARRLFVIIDLGGSAVCFLALSLVGHSLVSSIVLITITLSAYGFHPASICTGPIDVSPKYAGIISGIMFTVGYSTGFIAPIIVGLLIEDNNTFKNWSLMFKIIAGVQLFGMLAFLIFGKAEEQEWSKDDGIEDEETINLVPVK